MILNILCRVAKFCNSLYSFSQHEDSRGSLLRKPQENEFLYAQKDSYTKGSVRSIYGHKLYDSHFR